MRSIGKLLAVIVFVVLGYVGWDQWAKRTEAEARAESAESRLGLAGTRLLEEVFVSRGDLRVGRLTGRVSTPSRIPGFIFDKTQVTVVPFSTNYFLDLSKVRGGAVHFNSRQGTLIIDIPDISVEKPTIDMENAQIKQSGLIIFRGESIRLSKQAVSQARLFATKRSQQKKHMDVARQSARIQIKQLASRLYHAIGQDLPIVVRFPGEREASERDWDRSASIDEVVNR